MQVSRPACFMVFCAITLFSVCLGGCQRNFTPPESPLPSSSEIQTGTIAAVVSAQPHSPVLLDAGELLDNGGIKYIYWVDQPDISKEGSSQQERELSISYSSGKVYEIFLSTFQLDDGGQPTSLDSITCTSDKNQTPECLISDTPYGAHVSIKLATPSYATIQVTLNARADELPAQQSTWLL